jgi:hypothetical protein
MGQLIRELGACLNKEFGWLVDMIVFGHQPGLAAFWNPLACNGHESPFALMSNLVRFTPKAQIIAHESDFTKDNDSMLMRLRLIWQ